jgi:hypothetical protein
MSQDWDEISRRHQQIMSDSARRMEEMQRESDKRLAKIQRRADSSFQSNHVQNQQPFYNNQSNQQHQNSQMAIREQEPLIKHNESSNSDHMKLEVSHTTDSSRNKLYIGLGIIAVILLVAIGLTLFFLRRKKSKSGEKQMSTASAMVTPVQQPLYVFAPGSTQPVLSSQPQILLNQGGDGLCVHCSYWTEAQRGHTCVFCRKTH